MSTQAGGSSSTQSGNSDFLLKAGIILGVFLILIVGSIGPMPGGIRHLQANSELQTARQIGLAMFAYANDNNQQYPDGKSSTEVFQKLLDGGYISDPSIFYVPLAGKSRPIPGQKLKAENVSWDVTGGADSSSPDGLPLVFMTGYKITYASGAAAVPLIKPYPLFGWENPNKTWFQWLTGWRSIDYSDRPGMAVAHKSNSAMYKILDTTTNGDGSISNFVPPDFKPDGMPYRQLTPDGVLR